MQVAVGEPASLMLLTQVRSSSRLWSGQDARSHLFRLFSQGSTRTGSRPTLAFKDEQHHPHPPKIIKAGNSQPMTVRVSKGGPFYLLPDPVTCFKHASYDQVQTFHPEDGALFVVLDSSPRDESLLERNGSLEILQRKRSVGGRQTRREGCYSA